VWKFRGGSTTIYEESNNEMHFTDQVYTESTEMLPNKNVLLKVSKSSKANLYIIIIRKSV